jgi:hypothetical protein
MNKTEDGSREVNEGVIFHLVEQGGIVGIQLTGVA